MIRLRKRIFILLFILECLSFKQLIAQQDEIYNLFVIFSEFYNKGNYVDAEKCMLNVLKSDLGTSPDFIIPAYNNLGLIKKSLGFYTEALYYYDKGEELINQEAKGNTLTLAGIYINKSRIYTFQRAFPTALEYLGKAIRIYQNVQKPDKIVQEYLSTAWLNTGIVYYESGDNKSALENLNRSLRLKMKNNLPEIELTYLNIARTYERENRSVEADEFFTKCLNTIREKYGGNYYRMAEIYFGYGTFLNKIGKASEALDAFENALAICLKNFGEKHSMVALAYKYIGDFYLQHAYYISALQNYQRSLISISVGFSNTDFFSNPPIDSSLLDIRLLDILKKKAEALSLYQSGLKETEERISILENGIGTIDLSMSLAARIRNNYPTEESMIFLAGQERETALLGIQIAAALYELTHNKNAVTKMYSIVQRSKASVMRDEIAMNELLASSGMPDSLIRNKNKLAGTIAAYNNLILEELRKIKPDSNKIVLWKDALFAMNRDMETLKAETDRDFPRFKNIILENEPVTPGMIRKELHRNETVIDYLLSGRSVRGKRDLYIFVVTRNSINFRKVMLDSLFLEKAEIIKHSCKKPADADFVGLTSSLSYMYTKLIKVVEDLIVGRKLIIIPDEEISDLPFDALLTKDPGPGHIDYEGLPYLIKSYSLSYNYSSSLVFDNHLPGSRSRKVISFAPDYAPNDNNIITNSDLKGADAEIRSIYRWFRGKSYSGISATETSFRQEIRKPAIFHLAMHTIRDTSDSRYSSLLFSTVNDSLNDGKLFNYEISLTRMRSPMVVLSACNSGSGTLYHGEGIISVARGFLLAGASSVIRTSWEINDETSALIIQGFYKHLSRGKGKDESMRLAKLEYMKNSPPYFSNPYFWAAYEVVGNSTPIKHFPEKIALGIVILLIITGVAAYFYFNRRRIFIEGSL